jgi:predicted nucleic acid-binding protein
VTGVKLAEAFSGVRRLFLDTAPVIYYVGGNEHYLPRLEPVFEYLDAGTVRAVTSPITLSEAWFCLSGNRRRYWSSFLFGR